MQFTRFDRQLVAAIALIVLLTIAIVVNCRNTHALRTETGWVAHTLTVLDGLETINIHLREAESIQRTYLIVGGDVVPQQFRKSVDAAREAVQRVVALTSDNAQQQSRVPRLTDQIDELERYWTNTMLLRNSAGIEAATRRLQAGVSEQMMAALQSQLQNAAAAERQLLEERSVAVRQTYLFAQIAGLASGIASIAGVLAFILLMQRRLRERNAAARTIAEFGERLRTTLASIGDAVISTDTAGCITNMNPVAESLTGWSKQEAFGRPLESVFRIVNEYSREAVPSPTARALQEGVIVGLANHTVLITKDGRELPIDDSAAPIRCKQGEIVGCVLVFRDVGERRQLENRIQEQLAGAQLLASIVETSDDAIISKALNGIIRSWNAAAERIFGYSASEAIGQPITIVIPQERLSEEVEIIAALKKGERVNHFVTERVRRDGSRIWVSLTISPLYDETGEVVGASKIARDVSREREMVERERRLLHEAATANLKFRAYFDQGAVFAGLMDIDGTLIEANRLSIEGCGFQRGEVLGRQFAEGPWWSPSPGLSERVRDACRVAANGETFRGELPYYFADGSQRVAEVIIAPVKDETGKVLYLAPIGTDVTERKRVEADCQKFITVVENSTDFIAMCDLEKVGRSTSTRRVCEW
ncbi:MAG: PAS domain S-box protein [Planctomycetaceae bacterium]